MATNLVTDDLAQFQEVWFIDKDDLLFLFLVWIEKSGKKNNVGLIGCAKKQIDITIFVPS